jgi:DNA replication and repair protein RecF
MDTLLSQLNKEYLQSLILYNKILQQRNSFLKNAAAQGRMDNALLEILDLQLKLPANNIYQFRLEFSKKLIPFIQQFYKEIANSNEQIDVVYESRLHEKNIESLLIESQSKDLILQRTNVGIHKDDIGILLNGQSFKSTASQGQKKSLLFALKLAEYEMIKQTKGFSPVILLDDVFEKLDHFRMNNLLKKVCKENEGQVFITDTHRERLINSFEEIGIQGQIIEL